MIDGVQILVPPASEPITLDQAKSQCRVELTFTDDDTYLTGLIMAARDRAEAMTNTAIMQRTVREFRNHFPHGFDDLWRYTDGFYDGLIVSEQTRHRFDGSHHWELKVAPIVSVTQLQYVDQTGTTQTLAAQASQLTPPATIQLTSSTFNAVVNMVNSPAVVSPAPCNWWPCTQRGAPNSVWIDYTAGLAADISQVPPTLTQAMLLMISHWYSNREPVQMANLAELPMAVSALLSQNRVWWQP